MNQLPHYHNEWRNSRLEARQSTMKHGTRLGRKQAMARLATRSKMLNGESIRIAGFDLLSWHFALVG
jgi:hypothetical protein